jgi:hypothetical protein
VIKVIALRAGYDEDVTLPWVIFRRDYEDMYNDSASALQELADNMLEQYKADIGWTEPNDCCKNPVDPNGKFCSKCGTRLSRTKISLIDLQNYIRSVPTLTLAQCGDEWRTNWVVSGGLQAMLSCRREEIVIVPDSADVLLAHLAFKLQPPRNIEAVSGKDFT